MATSSAEPNEQLQAVVKEEDVEMESVVVPEIGRTGLPVVFAGDEMQQRQVQEAGEQNNNKDRWAKRFEAKYPKLQHVVRLSQEQVSYLESLTYDSMDETPAGSGRADGVEAIQTPLSRLAVEGSPVRTVILLYSFYR